MKLPIITLSLALLVLLMCLLPRAAYAQQSGEYIVNSAIIIPSFVQPGFKVDGAKMNQYKQTINQAMGEVQSLYAQLLNGKTFKYGEEVGVQEILLPPDILLQLFSLDSLKIIKEQNEFREIPGYIEVYWVLGTKDGARWAQVSLDNNKYARVFMRHQDLLALSGNDETLQKKSLYYLAHELGHAFGLARSGYAKMHSCSVESIDECLEGAPKPLPGSVEWQSIIGYGTPFKRFPNLSFNNSVCNPELQTLYKSPFLNPQGDPGPQPVACAPELKSFGLGLGESVTVGEVIRLNSTDFGSKPGQVYFVDTPSNASATYMPEQNYELIRWDNELIAILIKKATGSEYFERRWRLRVVTASGETFESTDDIAVKGKNFGQQPPSLAVNFTLICGDNKPVVGYGITLTKGPQDLQIGYGVTDTNGKGTLSYSSYSLAGTYVIRPDSIHENQTPTPLSDSVLIDSGQIEVDHQVSFYYASCPEATFIQGALKLHAEDSVVSQVLISNYDDFRLTNAPSDLGSNTLVINNPQEEQTVNWGLSTTNQLKYVNIREVYANQAVRDYTLPLGEGQRGTLGKVGIVASRQENIIKVTINGRELNLNDPSIQVNLASAGRTVPVQLTYGNGNVRSIIIDFQKISQPTLTSSSTVTPIPTSAPISVGGCFPHPQLGSVKQSDCTGGCDGNGCGLMSYYVCSVSGDISATIVTACSDRCQRCNPQSPTQAQDPQLCNERAICAPQNLEASSVQGTIGFKWRHRSDPGGLYTYQLRIDDTINPWAGQTKDGDIVENNVRYNSRFGQYMYIMNCVPGHSYKWWVHHVLGSEPPSPSANGPEVTCR